MPNYISPSVMTDANSEGFPISDERITKNDRCHKNNWHTLLKNKLKTAQTYQQINRALIMTDVPTQAEQFGKDKEDP